MIKDKIIGFCITGSFSTFKHILKQIRLLVEDGAIVIPIMSFNTYNLDTKYGKSKNFVRKIEEITKHKVIHTIQEAEDIYKKYNTDILAIIPCSGNTIAKLSHGISDTPVLVAVKSHLRSENNIVIGISTSDALSTNAENIRKIIK